LRHIHHFLFQDAYASAGEFRTVPIAKGDSFFARPEHIGSELRKLFHQLAGERCLRGNDSKEFCERAAYYLGEINALHRFREGNGRAQREFIRELALEAGYEVVWELVTQDEMFAASVASFHQGSVAAFTMILGKIIRPVR
jgi:fido (protein-threonine AMPylation protein)